MTNLNLDQARFNMVEQQIRTWTVLAPATLDMLMDTPREPFVPAAYHQLAYADIEIPLAHGQAMLFPKIEGHIHQALAPKADDVVLEVGTGSGFLTALLAKSAKHVYSVEYYQDLLNQAAANLKSQNISNVTLEQGDAAQGWNKHGPYNAIVLSGAMPAVPEVYKNALAIGGRLFVVVGNPNGGAQSAMLITRTWGTHWDEKVLFETQLPHLINAGKKPEFQF
ncbi:MAG: protein-L-isoaspartate O-methyltransferase [Gammaproteobacteria bacterium]|nr:protein-L-isoaspartate O-methyltransferase [Gammaproteobacteria bacterium]